MRKKYINDRYRGEIIDLHHDVHFPDQLFGDLEIWLHSSVSPARSSYTHIITVCLSSFSCKCRTGFVMSSSTLIIHVNLNLIGIDPGLWLIICPHVWALAQALSPLPVLCLSSPLLSSPPCSALLLACPLMQRWVRRPPTPAARSLGSGTFNGSKRHQTCQSSTVRRKVGKALCWPARVDIWHELY